MFLEKICKNSLKIRCFLKFSPAAITNFVTLYNTPFTGVSSLHRTSYTTFEAACATFCSQRENSFDVAGIVKMESYSQDRFCNKIAEIIFANIHQIELLQQVAN